jgi:hypothetical protein
LNGVNFFRRYSQCRLQVITGWKPASATAVLKSILKEYSFLANIVNCETGKEAATVRRCSIPDGTEGAENCQEFVVVVYGKFVGNTALLLTVWGIYQNSCPRLLHGRPPEHRKQ